MTETTSQEFSLSRLLSEYHQTAAELVPTYAMIDATAIQALLLAKLDSLVAAARAVQPVTQIERRIRAAILDVFYVEHGHGYAAET